MNLAGFRSSVICVRMSALCPHLVAGGHAGTAMYAMLQLVWPSCAVLTPSCSAHNPCPCARPHAGHRIPRIDILLSLPAYRGGTQTRPHARISTIHPSRALMAVLPATQSAGTYSNVPLFVPLFVLRMLPRRSLNHVAFWVLSSPTDASVVRNVLEGARFAIFARRHEPYAALSGNPADGLSSVYLRRRPGSSGIPPRVASERRSLPIARPIVGR